MNLNTLVTQKIAASAPTLEQVPGAVIIHNIQNRSVVYMSQWALNRLETSFEHIKSLGEAYFSYFFNEEESAEYVPQLLSLIEKNRDEDIISYFQQVRKRPGHSWQWYHSSTRIFLRDAAGSPLLILTVSLPIDAQHHVTGKVDRLLEENNILRRSYDVFASLTSRQKQILALMAKDDTSFAISKELHLSEETVKTHRRNIKKKLGAQNQYDIIKFAQAFNII